MSSIRRGFSDSTFTPQGLGTGLIKRITILGSEAPSPGLWTLRSPLLPYTPDRDVHVGQGVRYNLGAEGELAAAYLQ